MDDHQEPVAWGIIACNTGRIAQVTLDAEEVEDHKPEHIVPLYTAPQMQRDEAPATDVSLLRQALEAFESKYIVNCGAWRVQQDKAIAALKERLK